MIVGLVERAAGMVARFFQGTSYLSLVKYSDVLYTLTDWLYLIS
jgi:hypothetical protein